MLAGILSWVIELNMLYVAFTFATRLACGLSAASEPHSDEHPKADLFTLVKQ